MAEISKLGRYELRHILGQGAMGVVYEGYDPTLSRRVAIKTILRSHALGAEATHDYSIRFSREAKAAARLNHANIVQVYDFGVEKETAYLVMEFIQGRELRSFFDQDETFGIEESVRIMCELLDALDFAHEAGVIHRDVKPANVILDAQRRVKLADFGVARIQDGADLSQGGTMVGTPAYMSPEQITGGRVDRRTDLFSAGSILYQFLTGARPFKGAGAWTVSKMIVQDEPPLPSTITSTTSPMFDAIVRKALAKNPEDRFPRAKEFATALRDALKMVQIGASKDRGDQLTDAPERSATEVVTEARSNRSTRSNAQANETELEFWRSIKDGTDPDEFEFYLRKCPNGAYAELATHKVSKLRSTESLAVPAERDDGSGPPRMEQEPGRKVHPRPASDDETVAVPLAKSRKNSLPFAVIALALVAVAAGGVYYYKDPALKEPKAEVAAVQIEKRPAADVRAAVEQKQPQPELKASTISNPVPLPAQLDALKEGQQCLQRKRYDCAIASANVVLRFEPGNAQAQELRRKARDEQKKAIAGIKIE